MASGQTGGPACRWATGGRAGGQPAEAPQGQVAAPAQDRMGHPAEPGEPVGGVLHPADHSTASSAMPAATIRNDRRTLPCAAAV
jgi:hypothetical protein